MDIPAVLDSLDLIGISALRQNSNVWEVAGAVNRLLVRLLSGLSEDISTDRLWKWLKSVKYFDKAIERARFLLDPFEQRFRLMNFGNVDVVDPLEFLHRERLGHGLFRKGSLMRSCPPPFGKAINGLMHPKTGQGIAATQVIIKE